VIFVASEAFPLDMLVSVLTVPLLTLTLWLRIRLFLGVTEGGGVTSEWRREVA
jgi:hypothetical protein